MYPKYSEGNLLQIAWLVTVAMPWLAAEHHKKEVELFRHLGLHNPWADDSKKAEWPLVAESGQLLLNRHVWTCSQQGIRDTFLL